jgi:predicted ATP-grasp superfamily ATP-dependent carboligase
MQRKVLVLGDDTRVILAIARALGRRGIGVEVGWCVPGDPALASRFIRHRHELPWYAPTDDRWHKALLRVLEEGQFDLVIPVSEAAILAFRSHREDFASYCIALPDERACEVVFDKQRTYQLAESLGIPIPKTEQCDVARARQIAGQLRFPAIVKPTCSVRESKEIGKHFVRKVDGPDELIRCAADLSSHGAEILLQEWFDGDGVGVELLANAGEALYAFQHRRLHETNGHGSTYRESTEIDPDLLNTACRLMCALNYTGVAMVEFRQNTTTSDWRLIEINGRFWGSLPLAVAAGAEFPWFLFAMLVDGRREFPEPFRVGVRSRALKHDVFWMLSRCFAVNSAKARGWMSNSVPMRLVLAHMFRALTFRDHLDSFTWSDPMPLGAELFGFARAIANRSCHLVARTISALSFKRHPNALRAVDNRSSDGRSLSS